MMAKQTSRTWTAEEKLPILEEARQPNTSVAEVLRRHRVDGTTFDRWEREAKAAMREALSGKVRRVADRKDEEIARLKADLDKKRLVLAEGVEESLALQRGL